MRSRCVFSDRHITINAIDLSANCSKVRKDGSRKTPKQRRTEFTNREDMLIIKRGVQEYRRKYTKWGWTDGEVIVAKPDKVPGLFPEPLSSDSLTDRMRTKQDEKMKSTRTGKIVQGRVRGLSAHPLNPKP